MTVKKVFWHRYYLCQTEHGQPDIGHVIKPGGARGRFDCGGFAFKLTPDEEDKNHEMFATRAEANRFLEGVAKRLGFTLVARKTGWAEYMASYTAQKV